MTGEEDKIENALAEWEPTELLAPGILRSLTSTKGDRVPLVSKEPGIPSLIAKTKTDAKWHFQLSELATKPNVIRLLSVYEKLRALEAGFPVIFSSRGLEPGKTEALSIAARRSESALAVEGLHYAVEGLGTLKSDIVRFAGAVQMASLELEEEEASVKDPQVVVDVVMQSIFRMTSDEKKLDEIRNEVGKLIVEGGTDLLSYILNIFGVKIIGVGGDQKKKLMEKAGFKNDGRMYEDCIRDLSTRMGVIRPLFTCYWCPEHVDNPFSAVTAGHSQVMSATCPQCKGELASGTLFSWASPLKGCFETSEGALGLVVAWHLESSGVKWRNNCYLEKEKDDFEKDFIFKLPNESSFGVIECKSFKTVDEPNQRKESRLRDLLTQVLRNINALRKKDIPISRVIMVTNMEHNDALEKSLENLLQEGKFSSLGSYGVSLHGPNDLVGITRDLNNGDGKSNVANPDQ